jgi:hypothetical protein
MTTPTVSKDTSKPVQICHVYLHPKEKAEPVKFHYTVMPKENPDVPIRAFIHLSTLGNQSKGPKGPSIPTVLYRVRGDLSPYQGELKSLWNLTEAMIAQYDTRPRVPNQERRTKNKKPSVKVAAAQQAIKEVR